MQVDALSKSMQLLNVSEKVDQEPNRALTIIRNTMPLEEVFCPELQINLKAFIQNQEIFQELARFLTSFSGNLEKESLKTAFEKSGLCERMQKELAIDMNAHLELLLDGCIDAMQNLSGDITLDECIKGRIFTIKNALIAQQNPRAIAQSQRNCKLQAQSHDVIQKEGHFFLRKCLIQHLTFSGDTLSFESRLLKTAKQVMPFVQKITKSYLNERGKKMPDDISSFRHTIGYNHHGLCAPVILQKCLEVLGYNAKQVLRSDLEPKVTLATAHSFVVVTSNDKKKYIVDPCYIQFHKDVSTEKEALEPVLVLDAGKTETYVNDQLMPKYVVTHSRRNTIAKTLEQNNQIVTFFIEQFDYPEQFKPQNPTEWVRSGLRRVWDLNQYREVGPNIAEQEIFFGSGKTAQSIQKLGFAQLFSSRDPVEIEKVLTEMLQNQSLHRKNDPRALKALSLLPKTKKTAYQQLLDVDTRIEPTTKGIGLFPNAYYRSFKKVVNPDNRNLTALYGCSGADCTTILLSTNATNLIFVDLTQVGIQDFKVALNKMKKFTEVDWMLLLYAFQENIHYISTRTRFGGCTSLFENNRQYMPNLAEKLFLDLYSIGVDLNSVSLKEDNGSIQIEFKWSYEPTSEKIARTVTYISADITEPKMYPEALIALLDKGIDLFYMKAAFTAPLSYYKFIPLISEKINANGWLMTSDKTFMMEDVNPEPFLRQEFALEKSEETKLLENSMEPDFVPEVHIDQIEMNPNARWRRSIGSDLSYWTFLHARKVVETKKANKIDE